MTNEELQYHCEQIFTAMLLHKLLKAEGNPASWLLLQDIKEASLGRAIYEINEEWSKRGKSIFAGAKLLGPLV